MARETRRQRLKLANGDLNTQTAERCGEWERGTPGDADYIHETLHRTRRGQWFLHGAGGRDTQYVEWEGGKRYEAEQIIPLSEEEARKWADEHLGNETAERLFQMYGDSVVTRTVRISSRLWERLQKYCDSHQRSLSSITAAAILEFLDAHEDD